MALATSRARHITEIARVSHLKSRLTWKIVWRGTGKIAHLDWTSSRTGWMLVPPPAQHPLAEEIQTTTNGGISWNAIAVRSEKQSPIDQLYMVTDKIGWATAGQIESSTFPYMACRTLMRTTNGGRTWSDIALPSIPVHYKNPQLPPIHLTGFHVAGIPTIRRMDLWYGLEIIDIPHVLPRHIWTLTSGTTWRISG